MAAVNITGVHKWFGSTEVIRGVDIPIADGEFCVLVGPSGCGKSTLLRMIAGLEEITQGEIAIGGTVVNRVLPKERDIAMVFQNYALYPHMTVRDNMSFALKLAKRGSADIRDRVARAADILGLAPYLDRYPRQLSGGQRQRVAMGRAIVRDPQVFLFDEPLSNLDAKLRVQMRFEIQKLHRRLHTTSLYVTHDQVEAMTLAQRMVVMNAGRAEQIGSPMEVYENPQTLFVAGFIGSPSMNFMPGKANGDGRIALDHGGEARTSRATLEHGRAVTIGIRPEHLVPCGQREAFVSGPVEMVEQLGADALVHIGYGGNAIVARVPHGTSPAVGSTFCAAADPARVFAFDATTGRRLS